MQNKSKGHLQLVTPDFVPPVMEAPKPTPALPQTEVRKSGGLTRRGKVASFVTGALFAGGIGFFGFATPEKDKPAVVEILTGEEPYDVQPGDNLEGVLQKKFYPETVDQENVDPEITNRITLEANAVGPYMRDKHLPEDGITVTKANQITNYPLNADESIMIPTQRTPQ